MNENKTYIIFCRRGIIKNECPFITQQKITCVECPHVSYFPKVRLEQTEQTEQTENTSNES